MTHLHNNKAYKRINLRLDTTLYEQFNDRVKKSGLTKAKFLREVLTQKFDINNTQSTDNQLTKSFNFRIDEQSYKHIHKKAQSMRTTTSTYIRSGIEYSVGRKPKRSEDDIDYLLNDSYKAGVYSTFDQVATVHLEKLTIEQLIHAVEVWLKIGNGKKASVGIEALRSRINDLSIIEKPRYEQYLLLLDAEFLKFRREFSKSISVLETALTRFIDVGDRRLIGKIKRLLGILKSIEDDNESTIKLLIEALSYLDVLRDPGEIIETYNTVARYYTYKLDFSSANKFLQASKTIVNRYRNAYYSCRYYNEYTANQYIQGNKSIALESIDKSLKYAQKSGTMREMDDAYEDLGIIKVFEGKLGNAITQLNKSLEVQKKMFPDEAFSSAKLYKLFVASKDTPEKSINGISEIMKRSPMCKRSIQEVIFGAVQFLYSANTKSIENGRLALRRLADEGAYPLIREGARKLLETKRLHPVR